MKYRCVKNVTTAEEILHAPNITQNIKWTIKNKRVTQRERITNELDYTCRWEM
jgi:hypothetical protein